MVRITPPSLWRKLDCLFEYLARKYSDWTLSSSAVFFPPQPSTKSSAVKSDHDFQVDGPDFCSVL